MDNWNTRSGKSDTQRHHQRTNSTEENLDYVDRARLVIERVNKRTGRDKLTTSKLRNLLSMTADIQTEVLSECRGETLSPEIRDRIAYLKMRFVYEAGREEAVKAFLEEARILKEIEKIKGSKKEYLKFSRYIEALVAWHTYINGNK